MSAILESARRSSLTKAEIIGKRWEPKMPKDRRASRRPKKGAKKNANGK